MWDNGYETLTNSKNDHNALRDVYLHFNNVRMRCFYTDRNTNTIEEFVMTDYFNHDFAVNATFDYGSDDNEYMDEDIDYDYEINIGGDRNGILIDTTTNEQYTLQVNSASFEYFDKIRIVLQSHMDNYFEHMLRNKKEQEIANIEIQKHRIDRFTEIFKMLSEIYPSLIGYSATSYRIYRVFIDKCGQMLADMKSICNQYGGSLDENYMVSHNLFVSLLTSLKSSMTDWHVTTCMCLKRIEKKGTCPDVTHEIKAFI
jgi:hypothetical protein